MRSCLKVNMSSETPEFIAFVRINENGDGHICRHYERTFWSNRGLNQHLISCKQNIASKYQPAKERHECIETSTNTAGSTTTSSASQKSYTWGNYPSHVFEANKSTVYKQMVYWNLFCYHREKQESNKLMKLQN